MVFQFHHLHMIIVKDTQKFVSQFFMERMKNKFNKKKKLFLEFIKKLKYFTKWDAVVKNRIHTSHHHQKWLMKILFHKTNRIQIN